MKSALKSDQAVRKVYLVDLSLMRPGQPVDRGTQIVTTRRIDGRWFVDASSNSTTGRHGNRRPKGTTKPMTLAYRLPRRTAAAAALAVGAITALTACGADVGRMAAAVSASTSGVIVIDASTDLGSIIIGRGEEQHLRDIVVADGNGVAEPA